MTTTVLTKQSTAATRISVNMAATIVNTVPLAAISQAKDGKYPEGHLIYLFYFSANPKFEPIRDVFYF